MEKNMKNEMETGLYSGSQGLGFPEIMGPFLGQSPVPYFGKLLGGQG